MFGHKPCIFANQKHDTKLDTKIRKKQIKNRSFSSIEPVFLYTANQRFQFFNTSVFFTILHCNITLFIGVNKNVLCYKTKKSWAKYKKSNIYFTTIMVSF
jgi:hypothetical protein